ncbi:four helix bundle protein [Pedobacter puniceum]|uniref:Four helix bundle protein n=1 Tax=Pedobacter puniceum TaxID=2666136 RepID=A0A7K0FLG4_9SPHI|nr:four helix bundle protein [Pedobacter puniceum]MRX46080.1 four helix bundle protein [Pedobacter puniceum]
MERISKSEFADVFKSRTKQFVIDNIALFRLLPKTEEAKIIGKQLLRSSSSVGANYRAACRARSKAEFYSKLSIVVEEADESAFWLEVLVESQILKIVQVERLLKEANKILKVVASARKTVSVNNK